MHANAYKHTGCIGELCPHCARLDLPGWEAVRANLMPQARAVKPRLSIDQLAARRKTCQERKAAGLSCPDDPAPAFAPTSGPAIQVETRSAGIGDSLLTLCVAEGLRRQHAPAEIVVNAPAWVHPWLLLFDGCDRLTDRPVSAPVAFCDNTGDLSHYRQAGKSRWEWWGLKFGTTATVPASMPLPDAVREWAIPYSHCIALAPFAAYPERTWPIEKWLAVERELADMGFRVVILDGYHRDGKTTARCNAFSSGGKLIGEPPARVLTVLQTALCFAGNDSGMAHLAGMAGVRSVVVSSHASDVRIMGLYPRTVELGGRAKGYERITPADMVQAILAQAKQTVEPGFPTEAFLSILPEWDQWRRHYFPMIYGVLWRTVRDLRPRRIVEIGSRAGLGAWTMLDACPEASVYAIDVAELDASLAVDGGSPASAAHARALLADRAYTLEAADSHRLERIPECDLAYIDADHSPEGCLMDLLLAERSGATRILVDDYTTDGVATACRRFLRDHPQRRGRFICSQTGLFLIE